MNHLTAIKTKITHKTALIPFLILIAAAACVSYCSKDNTGTFKAPGIVDGDIITLKSPVAGTIQQIDITEGAQVSKETTLAQVNRDKIQNQLEELDIASREIDVNSQKITQKMRYLDSSIRYLHKQVERFRRLKQKNAVPGEQLESLELKLLEAETSAFDLKKTQEDLGLQKDKIENKKKYLQLLLEDHVILSPVNGVIMEKYISEGEEVFPGTAVVDIIDSGSLFVEVFIEETELAGLKLNQEVKIEVDGNSKTDPARGIKGKITYFGKKAEFSPKYIISEKERKSLLYEVKISVKDPKGILKIGMPVTVIF